MSTTSDHARSELRDGHAEAGDQRLHYVEAGEGPLVVLLHGRQSPDMLTNTCAIDMVACLDNSCSRRCMTMPRWGKCPV